MPNLTVVVAVRDEASQLPGCLRRLSFADEIVVVVDDRTQDNSAEIAEQAGARVIYQAFAGFADLKNAGLAAANSDWTLVVDADERVGNALAVEIAAVLGGQYDAFEIPRINYFYGHEMRWGGWKERHIRLVRTGSAHYVGELHETFEFDVTSPRIGLLTSPLHHFTHRSIIDNLHKTATFGDVDAHERLTAKAERVTSAKLYLVVLREILHRLIVRQGWRDGVPGTVECLYQPLSLLASRARLWELQQSPSIDELYAQLEETIE